jgi:hypothetical protein
VQAILLKEGRALAPARAVDVSHYAPKDAGCSRGALFTVGALVLVAAIVIPVVLATGLLSALGFGEGLGIGSSNEHAAVQATITRFCQALHDGNDDKAYSYLSPHYKETITAAADLPKKVMGAYGTAMGCSEGQGGNLFSASANSSRDIVDFTVDEGTIGSHNIGATVKFVKSGSTWLIDSVAA